MAKAKPVSIAAEYEYESTKIRGKDGKVRSSRGNGDAIARAMLVFTAGGGDIATVVSANKLTDKMAPHMKKKGPKAPGLQRMILGVMLRGLVRNGTPVKIGKITVDKLTQKVEVPKVAKLEKAAA
jgi:predicted secreted Zn-dependent protease